MFTRSHVHLFGHVAWDTYWVQGMPVSIFTTFNDMKYDGKKLQTQKKKKYKKKSYSCKPAPRHLFVYWFQSQLFSTHVLSSTKSRQLNARQTPPAELQRGVGQFARSYTLQGPCASRLIERRKGRKRGRKDTIRSGQRQVRTWDKESGVKRSKNSKAEEKGRESR